MKTLNKNLRLFLLDLDRIQAFDLATGVPIVVIAGQRASVLDGNTTM